MIRIKLITKNTNYKITLLLINIFFVLFFMQSVLASEMTKKEPGSLQKIDDLPEKQRKKIGISNDTASEEKDSSENLNKEKKVVKETKSKEEGDRVGLYGNKNYKSLFFTDKELEDIIGILKGQGKDGQDQTRDSFSLIGTDESGGNQQKISAVIYLNAILYLTEDIWTIWVNDKKISSFDETQSDLQVQKIDRNKVEFLWKVSRTKWEIMMPNFNFDNSISRITENNEVETIFELYPNQTFIPQTGEIIEGKKTLEAPEVTEGVNQQNGQPQNMQNAIQNNLNNNGMPM